METAVEKLTALYFLVFGLSHIVQPRVWVRFFIMLREKEEAGSLLKWLCSFFVRRIHRAFHNVWQGVPLIVTLVGWGLVLKSTIYFVFPRYGARMLAIVTLDRAWRFVVAGIFSVALGVPILYPLLQ